MMEAWLASKAFKMSKPLIGALAIAGLVALGGLGFWRGMAAIKSSIETAAESARAERNAHWKAEIAISNAEASARRAAQASAAAKAESEAGAQIARLTQQLTELERANATLPGGDACGIGRDRLRLLRQTP